MRAGTRRRQAGFTLLEAMIAISFVLMMMTGFGHVFARSNGVADQSYSTVRAHEEHDRNLRAVADILRCASWDSVGGFAADGTSTAPWFCRVIGSDAKGRVMDAPETLSWRAVSKTVHGVTNPGELVVTKNGESTVVASRVPQGGFVVRQNGNTLRVTLTTYYSASNRIVTSVSGDVSVSLRN
jgi:type II secretory pathway pseudopilin PulG